MPKLTEWTEAEDTAFTSAVNAIAEDVAAGASFWTALEHYADLFQIEEHALHHEWNLRREDTK